MNESLEDKLSVLFPGGYLIVYTQGEDIRINKFNPFGISEIQKAENILLAHRNCD